MIMFIFVLLSIGTQAYSEGLPTHWQSQNFELDKLALGNEVQLSGNYEIPDGYKRSSPAKLDIFEKQDNKWILVKSLKEKKSIWSKPSNIISFNDKIHFKSDKSDIAINLSAGFCKKICVINYFQGKTKRNIDSVNTELQFSLQGYLPMDKVKKEFRIKM